MKSDGDVHWRKRRADSWSLVAAGIALAAVGIVLKDWHGPSWILLVLGIVVAAGGTALAWTSNRAKITDQRTDTLERSSATVLATDSTFPMFDQVDRSNFGVAPSEIELPYLRRDIHQALQDRLVEDSPVLLIGHSMAGRTRLALPGGAAALRRLAGLDTGRPDGLATLLTGATPNQVVVWLDDLEAFLDAKEPLRKVWLDRLNYHGCRIIATIRASEYEQFRPVGEIKPPQWEVLQRFAKIRLEDDQTEQDRLARAVDDAPTAEGIRRYGLAEYIGGGYLAIDRYQIGKTTHPLATAMLKAAGDWRRLGFDDIPEVVLREVATTYLSPKLQQLVPGDKDSALTWACEEFGGRIRLLERTDSGWRVFDYLLDHFTGVGDSVPDAVWSKAAESAVAQTDRAANLGYRAYLAGRTNIADRLWTLMAPSDPRAAFNLGVLRGGLGDSVAAAGAYQLAIDSGHAEAVPMAAVNLGALRKELGDPVGAAAAYQLAIDSGHAEAAPTAAFNLGLLR